MAINKHWMFRQINKPNSKKGKEAVGVKMEAQNSL